MKPDNEGFLFPEINQEKCIKCNLCVKICPINKQKEKKVNSNYPSAFAVINNDENIRKGSTSGGVFSLLAEEILFKEGIVFGVKFDINFNVIHGHTNTLDGISEFRGSKYVQSKIGETFKECKNNLDKGVSVLFSGTPCQIEGLEAFLQKDYENLLTVDLICMSVPSPRIWGKYLEWQQHINNSKPKRIFFRYKNPNWTPYSMYLEFENHSVYSAISSKDLFLHTFGSDICARNSCYHCNFRTLNRVSDVTIADFWGIEKVCPEMFDNKGTSLLLINSEKGKRFFEKIKGGGDPQSMIKKCH